ncbi:MAG TPA: hypothetical protein VE988_18980 [Gemmataceae bacterium]|nr:hypothetical protein [Gemmataceae bacterium]
MPTPTWLRLAIVPVLAFLATVTDRNYLADFWHHLARGRAIVEQNEIVNHDQFTFTVAGQPFQDVNWLTQVGYYILFDAGGLTLVQLVNSLLIAVTMLLLVQLCRRRSGSLLAAAIAGGVAFFGLWEVLTIRPQTLSMLLFVNVLDLLERSERRPWLLFCLPPLVALWANLHGAFPAGIILIGCFTVVAVWRARDRRAATLAIWLIVCILATCINPYGWTIYRYVGGTSAIAYQRQIAEWVRPGPDRLIGLVWMASATMVFGLLGWRWLRSRQVPALRDALLLACFFALSCGSVRMVAWWMLVSAPVFAELLVWLAPQLAAPQEDAEQPSLVVGGVFALVSLAVVFSLPGLDRYNPLLGPTRRGQRVEEDLEIMHRQLGTPGNVYSHFEWGEYLSWSMPPKHKIFMDGRIEIYPDEVWQKYAKVTSGGDGWNKILADYGVDYLILDVDYHGKSGLLQRVEASPDWRREGQSRNAILYVRKAGSLVAH